MLFFSRILVESVHMISLIDYWMLYAQIIAAENQAVQWTTPLGLPVVQPYRKLGRRLVIF